MKQKMQLFARILCVAIENICKHIIPAANFAIQLAIANLGKLLDMIIKPIKIAIVSAC